MSKRDAAALSSDPSILRLILLAARIISLIEKDDFDLMVVCSSCYACFKNTRNILNESPELLQKIRDLPAISRTYGKRYDIPVLYYPQLLGLAPILSREELGLNFK